MDARYFWWQRPCPDFHINDTAGVTWGNVFTALSAALEIDIDVDDIHADYLQPSRALNLTHEAIPPILDAVCTNIHHVLVVDYQTGKVSTQKFETAKDAMEEDLEDHKERAYLAGGDRFLEDF